MEGKIRIVSKEGLLEGGSTVVDALLDGDPAVLSMPIDEGVPELIVLSLREDEPVLLPPLPGELGLALENEGGAADSVPVPFSGRKEGADETVRPLLRKSDGEAVAVGDPTAVPLPLPLEEGNGETTNWVLEEVADSEPDPLSLPLLMGTVE